MKELTPLTFMEAVNGLQKSAVARAAIELDIFSHIARGRGTVESIAAATQASAKGVRVLLDALTVLRLLHKLDNRYHLTDESALFLDRQSPRYMGDSVQFALSPFMIDAFLNFTQAVRAGGHVATTAGTMEAEHEVWVEYARAMLPIAMPQAVATAELAGRVTSVLDIAAGHGMFGIQMLIRNPDARCVAIDWPAVLEFAAANATQAGVAARWQALPGDAFAVDPGHGFDAILLPNFLHHFSVPDCAAMLRRMHAAMLPHGRLFVVEMVPNDNRVTPSAPAWFATMMLASTPSGDAYTLPEYTAMLQEAGFTAPSVHPVPGSARSILVSRKQPANELW
jgi:2-polyprenyl-3-methyl-5-hydroxy-6-metoxy-1,4-benzoquinol methylase